MPRRLLVVTNTNISEGVLALRTFAAHEILIVGHPDDEAGWMESGSGVAAQDARFGLPITHVTVAQDEAVAPARPRPGGPVW
jgi:hypothetical protein